MPNKEFLETYPLYRKFRGYEQLPPRLNLLEKVPINMECSVCQSYQTFLMINEYNEGNTYAMLKGSCFRSVYQCKHCEKFTRYFYIKVDESIKFLMKVGQFPSWELKSNQNIEHLLGSHLHHYKKGLVCESQGYGIAAFAYYRRVVEEIIDQLLIEILELVSGEELERYKVALEETQKTIVAQEKISLVKDLLPQILRPDGMNPIAILHSHLSEGLHANSDDECLEHAAASREILVFLVNQVTASKATSKSFTDNMRRLLEKKSKQASKGTNSTT